MSPMTRTSAWWLLIAVALLTTGVAAAQTQTATSLEEVVDALTADHVYVDPAAEAALSPADADELRARIRDADIGPVYVAILPADAAQPLADLPTRCCWRSARAWGGARRTS
jgi:hypothetical protein